MLLAGKQYGNSINSMEYGNSSHNHVSYSSSLHEATEIVQFCPSALLHSPQTQRLFSLGHLREPQIQ